MTSESEAREKDAGVENAAGAETGGSDPGGWENSAEDAGGWENSAEDAGGWENGGEDAGGRENSAENAGGWENGVEDAGASVASEETAGRPTEGRLIVVGTPIGNLEDMSPRGRRALAESTLIFCEDTRRTRKLLSALGVPAPRLIRLDLHLEASLAGSVVGAISQGRADALVTDAGMPTISDPGYLVVAAVAAAGLVVEVVPGPTAVAAALALSGLPASEYHFCGFLPRKGQDRRKALSALAARECTSVIYEAANRVAATIGDLAEACDPERVLAAAREITKLHEEVWRGSLREAIVWLDAQGELRGEWVLVVAGAERQPADVDDDRIGKALKFRMDSGEDRKSAVSAVAAELGVQKRRVYDLSLRRD